MSFLYNQTFSMSTESIMGAVRSLQKTTPVHLLQRACNFTLRQMLPRQYWRLAKLYYTSMRDFDIDAYPHAPNPYNIYWIDPSSISHASGIEYNKSWHEFGSVTSAAPTYQSISAELEPWEETFRLRFTEQVPWEQTPAVRRAFKRIEDGGDTRRSSKEKYLSLCKRWDRLYEVISTDGYKSQKQLFCERAESVKQTTFQRSFKAAICDEIMIDIGPNGELLFVDGYHRLALARLLDLDLISVVILRRHREWMSIREHVATTDTNITPIERGFTDDIVLHSHPDLQDVT